MAFTVILTQPATEDIAQTVDFIATGSSAAAAQWLDKVQEAIEGLAEMPLRAARIPENPLFSFEYRHLIHQSHRIIFRVDEATNTVYIVRLYHAARTPLQVPDL